MDAGFLEAPGPGDIVGLVESRLNSTTTVTCLPFFTASMSAPTMRRSPPVR
jgi:hypothetical protein